MASESISKNLRLTPADLSPVAEKKGLRPGLPPTWNDLREGRLLDRPVWAELRRAFDEWRERVTETPGAVPPVFCVCGREGDGKSVLLLQLAAALLRDGAVPALRLWEAGDDPRRFETPPPGDAQWYFVDQLPELIHGAAGEDWLRQLREQQPCFVVTTASPAALDWFAKKYPRKFSLTVWQLPSLSGTEAAALAAAGGHEAGADWWHEGVTLETFLFAGQRAGPLEQSLESLEVDLLPVVCAANLLGLAAPASLLKPEKQPAARQLAEAGWLPAHLSAAGLRLLTPGLARPLFDRWFPDVETRVPQLGEGFAQLLEIWLRENNATAASWFLRRLLHNEHLPSLLPPQRHPRVLRFLRKDLFRELYRQHRARHGERPVVGLLPAWLEIGHTFRLRPDVLEDAAGVVELAPDTLSPALAADIWHYSEYRKHPLATRLRQGVANYFKNTKADAGAALTRLYADTGQNEAAIPVLQHWLETHPFHPRFGDVFRVLLARGFAVGRIQSWARQCLGWFWRGKAAGQPLALLLQHDPAGAVLLQTARQWLAQHTDHPEAGLVLAALLENGAGEATEIRAALLWTAKFPVHPAAGGVWEILLKHHAGHSQVRQVALEWIKACPQHPQAAAMLLAIARKEKNNPAFIAAVHHWLETQPAHEQTPLLLETLASSTDEAFRPLLAAWLDRQPRHPAAARLLAAVLCAGKIGDDWQRRAEAFLRSGHPDALRVLRALLATAANENVLQLVWECLPKGSLSEQLKLSRWLGVLAGRQPERVAVLRAGLSGPPELAEEFFRSLRETLWDMPVVQLNNWMKRGFVKLGDADQQGMFRRLLEQGTPLPQPFSAALAVWLQRNFQQPAYQQMLPILRQHPRQGRYFHSASMLPLNILAEVTER